jgi:hypothetical protein
MDAKRRAYIRPGVQGPPQLNATDPRYIYVLTMTAM